MPIASSHKYQPTALLIYKFMVHGLTQRKSIFPLVVRQQNDITKLAVLTAQELFDFIPR